MAAPPIAARAAHGCDELKAPHFTERRELGALNIGGPGTIRVDGKSYELENLDCLYIGRGNPN